MFTALINNNLRLRDDVKFALKTYFTNKISFLHIFDRWYWADLEILIQRYSFRQFVIRIYFDVKILVSGSKSRISGQNFYSIDLFRIQNQVFRKIHF